MPVIHSLLDILIKKNNSVSLLAYLDFTLTTEYAFFKIKLNSLKFYIHK